MKNKSSLPKPKWLKVKLPQANNPVVHHQNKLHKSVTTVCEEARCPNMGECWNSGTATFMLMGDICTRGCRFCAVKTAKKPPPLDQTEPERLAMAVDGLGLSYVVLTTVDRDDLDDQGAHHICLCVKAIKHTIPKIQVEMLIPDFRGDEKLISHAAHCGADVIGHNIECVRSKTGIVRDPKAGYDQSLKVLSLLKRANPSIYTKSSLMVGFGESVDDVLTCLSDIRETGVDFFTIGQYLQPDKTKLPVTEYIQPDVFKYYEKMGLEMGFLYVASGPLVRSSYRAGDFFPQQGYPSMVP